jgi:hypothetical protein
LTTAFFHELLYILVPLPPSIMIALLFSAILQPIAPPPLSKKFVMLHTIT